jgi:hypothetical protein
MLGVNKKATNAITIITNNSEHQDLVQDLWPWPKKKFILSRYTSSRGLKLGARAQRSLCE